MSLWGYCIRRAGDPPPGEEARGIGGGEVRVVEGSGLGAWVSGVGAPPAATPEHLREHDRVVREALRTATPLPLRFGAAFADEGAVRAALEARADGLLASLERVRGRVEMGVALAWDPAAERERILAARPELRPAEERPAGGRAYLEARRREHALEAALRERAEALLERVAARVAEVLPDAEEVRAVLPGPGTAGTLAHLVHRNRMFIYRGAVERAREELPGIRLRVTGPWAPYSFA